MKKHFFMVFLSLIGLSIPVAADLTHTELTPRDACNLIHTDPCLIVLDVREPDEYCDAVGHIPGALNFPWISQFLQHNYILLDPCADYLVVCHSGGRSHQAATFLDQQRFFHVYDMTGGMQQWPGPTVTCRDSDHDGIKDDLDNCPSSYNLDQSDADADGLGNPCDPDCPNLDGVSLVDPADLQQLLTWWLVPNPPPEVDLDDNNIIDLSDFAILASYWLTGCSLP